MGLSLSSQPPGRSVGGGRLPWDGASAGGEPAGRTCAVCREPSLCSQAAEAIWAKARLAAVTPGRFVNLPVMPALEIGVTSCRRAPIMAGSLALTQQAPALRGTAHMGLLPTREKPPQAAMFERPWPGHSQVRRLGIRSSPSCAFLSPVIWDQTATCRAGGKRRGGQTQTGLTKSRPTLPAQPLTPHRL